MSVPKQRKTKSRRNQRRSHIFLKEPFIYSCSKCKKPVLPHTACFNCGYYKGREIIDVLRKLTKKEKKQKEKDAAMKERQEGKEKQEKPLTLEELSKR
ncbi:MAG: 50S ribosomal protein L32 [Candidatus Nealsonbacteria bacterium]|nr:50S ribosomal protein L32 [Candidatus Nealsonbacteria bacterium]